MIVRVMARCTGKTTELIRFSHSTGIPIVTSTYVRASFVENMAKRMGLDIPKPITMRSVIDRREPVIAKNRNILIDDLDAVIAEIFRNAGVTPVLATMGIETTDVFIQRKLYDEFEAQSNQWMNRNGLAQRAFGGADNAD